MMMVRIYLSDLSTLKGPFADLALLNKIAADPDVTQSDLAQDLKLAIGTVNNRLKRLVAQGSIEVKRTQRRKLRYHLTPEGLALQQSLTTEYVQQSFQLYRVVREEAQRLLSALIEAGYHAVCLVGEGDIADVCRLTCLENHVEMTDNDDAPALVVDGLEIRLKWL